MPMGPYKDFAACISAQKRKGKSSESANKICGEIKKRAEGTSSSSSAKNASSSYLDNNTLPASLKPAVARAEKALKFLSSSSDNNNADDTSLDNQNTAITNMSKSQFSSLGDEESYSDKITRIMDEFGVDEEEAKQVVNRLIEEEQIELDRRQYELTKQIEIDKAEAGETGQRRELVEEQQEQQGNVTSDNNNQNNGQ